MISESLLHSFGFLLKSVTWARKQAWLPPCDVFARLSITLLYTIRLELCLPLQTGNAPSLTCEFLCLMVYISLGKGDSRNAGGMLLFRLKPKSSEEQATAANNLTGTVENAPDFPLEGTSLLSSSPQRHKGCPAQHRGKSTYLGLKSGGCALRRYPSESRGAWPSPS